MVQILRRAESLVVTLGLIASLLITCVPAGVAHANINSCSATLTTNSTVSPNSSGSVQIEVDNTDSSTIKWIQVTRPSGNFTIQNAQLNNWGSSNNDSIATFTGGTIAPNGSATISLVVNAGAAAPEADWGVQVSDNSSGVNPFDCSGSLGMSIAAPDNTPPVISDISVSDITPSSATINWLTDEPSTSQVDYGSDDQYGQNAYDGGLTTSHSLVLTSLKPNSGYHYLISSADARNNIASSDDNTFLTASEPQTGQGGTTPAVITNNIINFVITNPADKTPPTIEITSKLPKVVKTTPVITGTAGDDLAVVRIEYSTDGGQNWLPVDNALKLGGKAVDFSFTPANLDDGSYSILARAIDAGGNITATTPITVVIDRLQPIVGGSVLNLGPQILRSTNDGVINTAVGVDQKITLSAIGGPTTVNLTASPINSKPTTKNSSKTFSLTQSSDTGLWQGILSFGDAGAYSLTANATDGAGNKTSRVLATVEVSSAGKVIKKGTNQAVKNAKVTVYYLDNESNNWVVWDGAAYGQTNPQTTGKDGQFNLFLPTGKYYLKASATGYRGLTSDAFTITEPVPISATLAMTAGHSFWPSLSTQKISLNSSNTPVNKQANSLIGKQVPTFSLTNMDGKKVNSLDWLAKPTLISLNATWSPETIDQLKVLQQMQSNQNYNVISVGLEQTASQLGVYNTVSGLSLSWLPDPDGTLADMFNAQSLPTNYFVDRTGVIRHVTSGVMTKQQILDTLSGL